MPLSDSSDLLTKEELTAKLGIAKRTLDTWLAHKIIPSIRIGNIVRFDWLRVKEALLEKCEVMGSKRRSAAVKEV